MSAKIHATFDALGYPTAFYLSGGQAGDLERDDVLLPDLAAATLAADKGYDADALVLAPLSQAGKEAVIPPKSSRMAPREYVKHLSQARHLIDNFFAKLKQFRAIATRYDKTARNFLAAIIMLTTIWLE